MTYTFSAQSNTRTALPTLSAAAFPMPPSPLWYRGGKTTQHLIMTGSPRIKSSTSFPFKRCAKKLPSANLLKDHLLRDHKTHLHKLLKTHWSKMGLFPCFKYQNQTIFKWKGYLQRHILQNRNISYISKDNMNISKIHIPTPVTSTYTWDISLPWLHNLHL